MFGKRITLFKLFGFAVRIDLSWLVILALVVWSFYAAVFPEHYQDEDGRPLFSHAVYLAMAVAAALGFFGSIVFHELSHSLVARRYGMQMKGITLFIFGGVAEMSDEPPSAKAEFMMAIAGPLSSVLVAAACFGVSWAGTMWGWHAAVTGVFWWVAFINGILVVFNMIPGFPLDGGRVLRSILWSWKKDLRWATYVASRIGAGFGAVLIAYGVLLLLSSDSRFGGLWNILIGLFLRGAAKSGYQQVLIRQALVGESLRRFMTTDVVTVPPQLTLAELVDDYVYRYHYKMFPVTEGERLVGCITTRQVKEVPREQWAARTVGEVARACSARSTISPDADPVEALSRMSRGQATRLMVVEDGRLVGIVSLKDLLRFLSLKIELESGDRSARPPIPDAGEE